MATPTLTDGRVLFNSCDTGTPSQMGGQNPPKRANETQVHMQGSGCGGVATQTGAEDTTWGSTVGGQLSGTSVDLTNKHFWVWCSCIYLLFTKASHGMAIGISSSGNTQVSAFTFTGGDEYTGGFVLGCANASGTADTGSGYPTAATLTAIVGMGCIVNAQFQGETYLRSVFFDAMRVSGTTGVTDGYSVTGGTGTGANAVTLADIDAVDMAQANRYGICYYKDGSYLSTGEIHFGAAATNTYIEDSNQTFSFLDLPVHATSHYAMKGISGTTSTTSILMDSMTVRALGTTNFFTLDMSALTGTNDVFTCSNWNVSRATLVKFSSKCTVAGWTFNDCTDVQPNGITLTNPIFNNCDAATLTVANDKISGGSTTLHNTLGGAEFVATNDLSKVENHAFDNTGGLGHAISITATGTYTFTGNTFDGYSPTNGATFHTQTGIEPTTDIMTTDSTHGFSTAEPVILNDDGGTDTVGLTEGTVYYVNAQSTTTLSFHATASAATADTGRIALTDGASGETQSVYSGNACIENNSGGAVTINVAGGGDTPTYRNVGAATTTVNNTVTVKVQGLSPGTAVKIIADATVGSVTAGDTLQDALADGTGITTLAFNYEGDLAVTVRCRQHGLPTGAIADDNGSYTDQTTAANSSTTDDMTLLPATPVANQDRYLWGHYEQFTRMKLDVSNVATGATITWQYWNGAWTSLSGVSDGTSNFSVSGESTVSWTLPGDWATTTINSQGPFYYVRAALTAGTPDQALGRKCQLDVVRYLPFVQENTILSTGLTVTATWIADSIAKFLPTD